MKRNYFFQSTCLVCLLVSLTLPACEKYEDINNHAATAEFTCSGDRDAALPAKDNRLEGTWYLYEVGDYTFQDIESVKDKGRLYYHINVENNEMWIALGRRDDLSSLRAEIKSGNPLIVYSTHQILESNLIGNSSVNLGVPGLPGEPFDFWRTYAGALYWAQCYRLRENTLTIAYGKEPDDLEFLHFKRIE